LKYDAKNLLRCNHLKLQRHLDLNRWVKALLFNPQVPVYARTASITGKRDLCAERRRFWGFTAADSRVFAWNHDSGSLALWWR